MRGWAGIPGHVRQSWGPGWALVGDAGYYKDPITTHGMSDGLRDAELLADAVLEVLAGRPSRSAMAAYQDVPRPPLDAAVRRDRGGGALRLGLPARPELLRTVSSAMSDEVDHLQSLPDRRVGRPGIAAFIPTDNVDRAG